MGGLAENSILGKSPTKFKQTRYGTENHAELPHVLSLYHSPNLSKIYSKNYAFLLPPPVLVEVLVFLYLGAEDILSVNLYGFPEVLYYLCSSEIP